MNFVGISKSARLQYHDYGYHDKTSRSPHNDFDNHTFETANMATELTVQSERAFQKQPIFTAQKVKAKSSKVGKGGRRWYKDVGLGFRTPRTAIEGDYIGRYYLRRRMSECGLSGDGAKK